MVKKYFVTVDDERQIRDILKRIAKMSGSDCEVHEAEDGGKGYALLEKLSSEEDSKILLFTDNGMPNLTGLEMIKKIKDNGLMGNRINIYMCFSPNSNYGEEIGIEAVEKYGANGYFLKPVDVKEIKRTIEDYFS